MSGIGIDLGTSYSCVGVWQHGKIDIIANEVGMTTTPSLVAFGTEELCGEAAESQQAKNPANTVYDIKRLMGKKCADIDTKNYPFKVDAGDNDRPSVIVTHKGQAKAMSPEELSAIVLTQMRNIASGFIDKRVTNAVISVPAHFNDAQR